MGYSGSSVPAFRSIFGDRLVLLLAEDSQGLTEILTSQLDRGVSTLWLLSRGNLAG